MKRLVTGLCAGLVIGISAAYALTVHSEPKPTTISLNGPTITELLTLVNAERAKNGVAPLKEDYRLDKSAQMKANDEVAYSYFGHVSPHDGKHGYEYINNVGIFCKADGENIFESGSVNDSKSTVDGWISSPLHHAAMLKAEYTLTGFGINGNQIVEHFCSQ